MFIHQTTPRLIVVGGGGPEITEPFTYSNGRLQTVSSSAWSDTSSNCSVSSNDLIQAGSSTADYAYYGTQVSSANHYCQAVVNISAAEYGGAGVLVRGNGTVTGGGSCYRIELGYWSAQHHTAINRRDSGSGTDVGTPSNLGSLSGDQTLRVEVSGTTITVKHNGTTVETYTGATSYTTQRYVGVYISEYGGAAIMRSFEAGAL